ncbi:MAG: DUF418 domain-containing protein [Bacteroidales bacterium]|nr:DUF418 domain-containing protein [Bacteroidales bacterium]
MAELTPSLPSNRIALLDIFRGFALLGIFVVNIEYMSSSVIHPEAFTWMNEGKANSITDWILVNFFNGKFFPIFSFLFGVGFGMQLNKMEEKGSFSASFFLRRYFFLLLFGVVHILFIWGGDVLLLYSLAGFLVLLLRKVPIKWILTGASLILIFPFYGHILGYINGWYWDMGYDIMVKPYTYDQILAINVDGSIWDRMNFRLLEYTVYYRNVEYFPTLLFMIFTGYAAGRYRFYKKIPETLGKLNLVAVITFLLIILFRLVHPMISVPAEENYKLFLLLEKLNIICNIGQAFLYLFILSFLYEKRILVKLIEPLAYAGRMSLTNYLFQSIIGMIVFSGFFFGLYGQLNITALALIALGVYALMVGGSKLWTQKFRYGPLEFIWRELTYKVHLKFLKKENNNQNIN